MSLVSFWFGAPDHAPAKEPNGKTLLSAQNGNQEVIAKIATPNECRMTEASTKHWHAVSKWCVTDTCLRPCLTQLNRLLHATCIKRFEVSAKEMNEFHSAKTEWENRPEAISSEKIWKYCSAKTNDHMQIRFFFCFRNPNWRTSLECAAMCVAVATFRAATFASFGGWNHEPSKCLRVQVIYFICNYAVHVWVRVSRSVRV